jgi:hypothetical protein
VTRGRACLPAALLLAVALGGCAGTAPGTAAASAAPAPSGPASTSPPAADTGIPAPGTPAPEDAGRRIAVAVDEGRVSGDTGRVPVALGEAVTLVVASDTADEVHVHGYDLTTPVSTDRPASTTFDADLPGVFEVELHEAGTVLLTLQVG